MEAPNEIRGSSPIATSVNGIQICEVFRIAKLMISVRSSAPSSALAAVTMPTSA
jgi:hypothetical protein